MDHDQFQIWSKKAAEWGSAYRRNVGNFPVRPDVLPGQISGQIANHAPENGESMDAIFEDFEKIIVPGMTHWQHPRFFAYFNSNAAGAATIAEYLANAISAQCMLWQTSPAATELETKVLDWLRQALDLPPQFQGVIQDSASSATLAAVLVMREKALGWNGNTRGLFGHPPLRVYTGDQVHSSIDRAIWFAGIGAENLVRVPSQGKTYGADMEAMEAAIKNDIAAGFQPAGIVASVGGTSIGGTDDVAALCALSKKYGLYIHVDAAWAGSAMICEENRRFWAGVEVADSVVLNPHKWLGTPFDLSAHFVRSPEELTRTLAIQPEYLKTQIDGADLDNPLINYSEWSVPLGRRFRALKLWFLLRFYGLDYLRGMIRNHIEWSVEFANLIRETDQFEITSEPIFSLFTFRFLGDGSKNPDELNQALVDRINKDGRTYLTQTRLDGALVIRVQIGQFETTRKDIDIAYEAIVDCAKELNG